MRGVQSYKTPEGGFIYILVKRSRGAGSGEQGRKIENDLVLYP
jgi:hypothetical protein